MLCFVLINSVLLNLFGLESREGFCQTESGMVRSFHVEGQKTEKALEPTVESLVRGIFRLRISLRRRAESTGGCVKLKPTYGDNYSSQNAVRNCRAFLQPKQ